MQSLWSELQQRLDVFFVDLEIAPSLLHGDLWSGNAAETETEPGNAFYHSIKTHVFVLRVTCGHSISSRLNTKTFLLAMTE